MNYCNVLAIDVAKNVFQLYGVDTLGNNVLKKRLSRSTLGETVAKLPPCRIVMAACGSTYYWARRFKALGHEVQLISPQYVKPFVKGNKNDGNDAQAIAEAAMRPNRRFVPLKTIEQQAIQGIHRSWERLLRQRTAWVNQLRGLLAEYGISVKQSVSALGHALPAILEDATNELSENRRGEIHTLYEAYQAMNKKVKAYDQKIQGLYQGSEEAQRLGAIEGVGPLIATAMLAIGDIKSFKNGRHFAAFLGLVPRECSSGNKQRLLGISKRGNRYLRCLLIHGARSVLLRVG